MLNNQLQILENWRLECTSPRDYFLNWGSPLMNYTLQGAGEGSTIIIGGAPNFGKSALLTSTIIKLLEHNKDITILDFSLDDPLGKRLTQYVANMARLPMNDVMFAHKALGPVEMERFSEAYDKLRKWMSDGSLYIYEATADDNAGKDIVVQATTSFITKTIREVREAKPNTKLIVAIDAINDVDLDIKKPSFSELSEEKTIVKEITRAVISAKSLCIVTSHLRKNEMSRPTLEDIRGNSFFGYSAKAVFGLYNDVKAKRNNSNLVWEEILPDGTTISYPIVELHVLKSKTSDYNGIICMQQWPAQGRVEEPDNMEIQKNFQRMVFGTV